MTNNKLQSAKPAAIEAADETPVDGKGNRPTSGRPGSARRPSTGGSPSRPLTADSSTPKQSPDGSYNRVHKVINMSNCMYSTNTINIAGEKYYIQCFPACKPWFVRKAQTCLCYSSLSWTSVTWY